MGVVPVTGVVVLAVLGGIVLWKVPGCLARLVALAAVLALLAGQVGR